MRKRRLMNQINVVPYIDVTLVLLVIFMVTAPMTNPGVVELPEVGETLKQTGAPIVITIKLNSTIEIEGVRRAMRATYNRELDFLDAHLPFLASVGSVSPYIGLFGTVWGIMNAFRGLANVAQATLTQVAPGIAEALIATAIGLFAAIPAVIAYNRFATSVDRLSVRYESFMEEFVNILQRKG